MEESLQLLPISSSSSSSSSSCSSSSHSQPKQATSEASCEKSLSIPNELIIEILTWLPVKTLVRFGCVSKFWRATISTPKFIKAHLRNSSKRDHCALTRVLFRCMISYGDMKVFNFDTRYFRLVPALFAPANAATIESSLVENNVMISSASDIVGSSNGLVCVNVNKELFFWNPAIRKFKKLAEFDAKSKKYYKRQIFFEYNEVDDDYQVYVVAAGGCGEIWIDVYSGNLNSWKRIEGFVFGDWPDNGFLVASGRLYWGKCTSKGAEICFIDLKRETSGVVGQPKYGKGKFDFHFAVLDGCLAVCCYYRTSHVDLWIMKEHGMKESWTKVLLVPDFKDPSHKKSCMPIFMSKDGKILFRYWKFLALSDPMTKTVTHRRVSFMGEPWQLDVLVESLVLVNDHDSKGPVKNTTSCDLEMQRHLTPYLE